jgi:hypothetical protein
MLTSVSGKSFIQGLRNNLVLRKSIAFCLQVVRKLRHIYVEVDEYKSRPPNLVNSFPKSGTHLLLQIIRTCPHVVYFGSFIASMPSIPFRERTVNAHRRLVRSMVPGEVVPAHLFYDPIFHAELARMNTIHYFIYRDPRDVVISEAFYLAEMNRWHRMHGYFARSMTNTGERISTAILGIRDPSFPYDYPDISKRFSRYRGWLDQPDVCTVKYEDLMAESRTTTLQKIAKFWLARCKTEWETDELVQKMQAGIDPEKSHTYRKGKVGGWRNYFSETHKEQMKSVAGDLLVELGYETDLNW